MGFFQQAEIGNDWLVLAICIGLLLPLVSIGPDYRSYRILLRKMLTFKVPGNELSLAAYSLPGSIIAVLSFSVSMASVVYCLSPIMIGDRPDPGSQLNDMLSLVLFSGAYLLVRMQLYTVVNPLMFRFTRFSRDQYRWPVFCQMVYIILSQVLALFSIAVLFLGVPIGFAALCLFVFFILVKVDVFIALYDTLFGHKGNYFIFFAYLCAVELAPVFAGWLVLTRFVLIF